MELSDILNKIEDYERARQRRISKNNITVRVSDTDLESIAAIKSIRDIKTSQVIKESIAFYLTTLQNKTNK